MGTALRADGTPQIAAGTLIRYTETGEVVGIANRYETSFAVLGRVTSDTDGLVVYDELLPPVISVKVASGGTATAGRPAVIGGTDGFTNSPTLGSGNVHFVSGIFAASAAGGVHVDMHPFPHFCPGGDVE